MEVDLILEILDPLTLGVMLEKGQGDDRPLPLKSMLPSNSPFRSSELAPRTHQNSALSFA